MQKPKLLYFVYSYVKIRLKLYKTPSLLAPTFTKASRVHTPADMKGLKIRTMESQYHMAHFIALGANAIPLAFSEVFTALQQGAIDGQENPYCNIYTQAIYEVQGYIIETAHIFDIIPVLVSKAAYDKLPRAWLSPAKARIKFFNVSLSLKSTDMAESSSFDW